LNQPQSVIVTGGAGFIGSNFILDWFAQADAQGISRPLVNLDKLTYAGNPENLAFVAERPDYTFVHGDICDAALVASLFEQHRPSAILHFAAESHVDRSIAGPEAFLRTNIDGTFTPNSPYAASKASSDHLVRAWVHTYKLPALVTNCSNNYGPYQFPEKLIPLVLNNALNGKPLPIYGDGQQVRDWLFVGDHCSAIRTVLETGRVGETYNVGGGNQRSNLEVVTTLCALLDELRPDSPHVPHKQLMTFVTDRPGHDRRYAIDARKIESELNWHARESFETGLRKTVQWYLDNSAWVENVTSGAYQNWMNQNYASRAVVAAGEGSR